MSFKEVMFVLLYVEDLVVSREFYETILGFKMQDQFSENEIFGSIGEVNFWISGGYSKNDSQNPEKLARATVMLQVESTGALFKKLKAANVEVIQEKPVQMGENIYWIQFKDPSGNVLEVLGAE